MDGDYAPIGLVFYLFAIFCAYWAQERGRGPWIWFFFGLFLAPFAGPTLLVKNAADIRAAEAD